MSLSHNQKADPTHTLTVRKDYRREFQSRWRNVRGLVRKSILGNDALGIVQNADPLPQDSQASEPEAVDRFGTWFESITNEIVDGQQRDDQGELQRTDPWADSYINRGYVRGIRDADIRARKVGVDVDPEETDEVTTALSGLTLGTILAQQSQRRNPLLRVRGEGGDLPPTLKLRMASKMQKNLAEITGLSADMNKKVTREVVQAMSEGVGGTELTNRINQGLLETEAKNRAATIARTEVVRAHAEATLDRYEQIGIQEVSLQAEWTTAGDFRVCPRCEGMGGTKMSIQEARGLIPLHPNCRCSWVAVRPSDVDKTSGTRQRVE